ncbi:hypothetical protein ALO62_102166 [Pseudomonas amygdali pv. myricae]|nr:hypothetical protein ALO62_102166 [Pseudomonas amygdali pv. myricae]RMT54446.1 hypothetical protein ALP46_101671 [Pseudomonas amygdali pv. myricae]RMV06557.1 hypothetical protein ALP18_101532 [Pseudomonas amygdali pv. myricae]RMV25577.1 hypothetical protein ALP14_101664 [Pseudomonas amygdali pv. myricae]
MDRKHQALLHRHYTHMTKMIDCARDDDIQCTAGRLRPWG